MTESRITIHCIMMTDQIIETRRMRPFPAPIPNTEPTLSRHFYTFHHQPGRDYCVHHLRLGEATWVRWPAEKGAHPGDAARDPARVGGCRWQPIGSRPQAGRLAKDHRPQMRLLGIVSRESSIPSRSGALCRHRCWHLITHIFTELNNRTNWRKFYPLTGKQFPKCPNCPGSRL